MDKNKKKTLTISGGVGKKISAPSNKPAEKKVFNVFKKKPQGNFIKKSNQGFNKPLINQAEKISQESMLNNKLQKDLYIQIQEILLNPSLRLEEKTKI